MSITVADVADAIEKNGVPQIRGEYVIRDENAIVVGACAIGQAAINLGVNESTLSNSLNRIEKSGGSRIVNSRLDTYIIYHNDTRGASYKVIANLIRKNFAKSLDEVVVD